MKTDSERLLAFLEIADNLGVKVEEELLDTYIYLLKVKGIPFNYTFIFQPLPYSKDLRNDLLGLKLAGYISFE